MDIITTVLSTADLGYVKAKFFRNIGFKGPFNIYVNK